MTQPDPGKLAVREPPKPKPKRVYKSVTVAPDGSQWRVHLDGKALSTPMRKPLVTGSQPLAAAIAAEWDAQKEHVDPATMPLTRLLSTAIDKVSPDREGMIQELLRYVDADVLCYRAEHPADLRARQVQLWQPVLDWAGKGLGVEFAIAQGIMPLSQSPQVLAALQQALSELTDVELTAFQATAALSSSLVLSLALVKQHLDADGVFQAAHLDELYQAEKWGDDEEAAHRRAGIQTDLNAIETFLSLYRPDRAGRGAART